MLLFVLVCFGVVGVTVVGSGIGVMCGVNSDVVYDAICVGVFDGVFGVIGCVSCVVMCWCCVCCYC